MTIKNIENNEVYQQVLSDSFGGVMYDVSNLEKYPSSQILKWWDEMTPSQKESSGGVMKGAISFLKGDQT